MAMDASSMDANWSNGRSNAANQWYDGPTRALYDGPTRALDDGATHAMDDGSIIPWTMDTTTTDCGRQHSRHFGVKASE
jgi:hypothetical protein